MGLGREPRVGGQRNLEHCITDCIDLVTWGRRHRNRSCIHDLDYDLEVYSNIDCITYQVSEVNSKIVTTFKSPIHSCNYDIR